MRAIDRVHDQLEKRGSKGVTFKNFGTGFRLAARIKDLRDMGHDIRTLHYETYNNDGERVRYARYVLMRRKNN